jgi:hypothetical protein
MVVSGPMTGLIPSTAGSRPAALTVNRTVSAGYAPAARLAAVTTLGEMTSVPAGLTMRSPRSRRAAARPNVA